ncbi:protease [Lithospermum erythrorhizon]|uniref:Protease n=1 Tax=Lithospermum erythrorhizon TaxID=34254 RepID=A0AAV3PQM6_LITER
MASIFYFLLILSFIFSTQIIFTKSKPLHHSHVPKPEALIFPVVKDNSSHLHITEFKKRTPLKPISFLIDLNARFLWVNCQGNYLSSSYNAPHCHSIQCMDAGARQCHNCLSKQKPGCHNNTCAVPITNPLTRRIAVGELAQDVLSIQTVNQSIPGTSAIVPRFLFACALSSSLQRFPKNVQGVAALGHAHTALPMQFASNFGLPPIFAICLPSSSDKKGVVFFGNTSYALHPGLDFSRNLYYTPLTIGSQGEYLIPVSSITIHRRHLVIHPKLASKTTGFVSAMISTTTAYTILENSLFRTIHEVFTSEMLRASRHTRQVKAIEPFTACFANLTIVPKTDVWAPIIHFTLHKKNVTWSILSSNSLVEVEKGLHCLAFVDGGKYKDGHGQAPIVIGAHQLEDNVVQFDLEQSRLGFRYALRFSRHSCSAFEFNPSPPQGQ